MPVAPQRSVFWEQVADELLLALSPGASVWPRPGHEVSGQPVSLARLGPEAACRLPPALCARGICRMSYVSAAPRADSGRGYADLVRSKQDEGCPHTRKQADLQPLPESSKTEASRAILFAFGTRVCGFTRRVLAQLELTSSWQVMAIEQALSEIHCKPRAEMSPCRETHCSYRIPRAHIRPAKSLRQR